MAEDVDLAHGQQAIYDSVYEALADYTTEDDAREQALEAATQPVPYRGGGTELGFHRGGPAAFFGSRMNMSPGNIVDFPPVVPNVPSSSGPRETSDELIARAERTIAEGKERFPSPFPSAFMGPMLPLPASAEPPVASEFPRSSEPPPIPLPLGTGRTVATMRSSPRAVDPLEDIRKQINAVQFKTAQDALDAATHFQALRAYQRDVEAGKDPTRWLPLLFKKNPTVIPSMMRERRMSAPVNIRNVSGYDVLSGGGGTPRVIPKPVVPGPVQGFPVRDENGAVLPDFIAVPSSTGRGMEVRLRRQGRSQSQGATEVSLLRRINDAEDEFKAIPQQMSAFEDSSIEKEKDRKEKAKKPFEEAQKRRESLRKQIDGWRAELRRETSGAPSGTNAPTASSAASSTNAPAASKPKDPVLEEANEALRKRPDKRAEILKRLKEMGYDVK